MGMSAESRCICTHLRRGRILYALPLTRSHQASEYSVHHLYDTVCAAAALSFFSRRLSPLLPVPRAATRACSAVQAGLRARGGPSSAFTLGSRDNALPGRCGGRSSVVHCGRGRGSSWSIPWLCLRLQCVVSYHSAS
jgi:hypothetical protein